MVSTNTNNISDFDKDFLEYFEAIERFEKNLNKDIQDNYKKYLDIKGNYYNGLNETQRLLLDEIMYNLIEIQVIRMNPRPKSFNMEVNEKYYIPYRNHPIHKLFQHIRTKNNEVMTKYLRSNRFIEECQKSDYKVIYRPFNAILECVKKYYK